MTRREPTPQRRHFVAAICISCVVMQFVGGDIGRAGAATGFTLATVGAFWGNSRHLWLIVLLCFPALGLGTARIGNNTPVLEDVWAWIPTPVIAIGAAGGDWHAPLGVMLGALGRVVADSARQRVAPAMPSWATVLFLAALVPATLGAVEGQALGLEGWSQGLRGILALGGLFWGALIAVRKPMGAPDPFERALRIGLVGGGLLLCGLLRGHFLFIAIGMLAAALPQFSRPFRPVALLIAASAVSVAMFSLTLTTAAAAMVAIAVVLVAKKTPYRQRRAAVVGVVTLTLALSAGTVYAVYVTRSQFSSNTHTSNKDDLGNYVLLKIFEDRGPLWLAALDQVTSPPWIVVPAGRPLAPTTMTSLQPVEAWAFGAHNASLELLRNVGWVSGVAGIVLMIWSILMAAKTVAYHPSPVTQAVAAGFVGTAVAGLTTGNFPIQDVGFFVWTLGGFAVAAGHGQGPTTVTAGRALRIGARL